jgi:hypothetical protein
MNLIIGESSYRPSHRSVLLDTGTSMIMIYQKDLKKIMKIICDYIEVHLSSKFESQPMCHGIGFGYYQIAGCSPEIRKQLPILTFQIGSYPYDLRPEMYTTYKSWTKSCTVNLYGSNDEKWILGAPFLADWY